MEKKSTSKLNEVLLSVHDRKGLDDFLKSNADKDKISFKEFVKEHRLDAASLYKEAGIDRSYLYKIFDGSKRPGKDKIIRICIAARLTISETNRALKYGGERELYSREGRDAVITYAIIQSLSVIDTDMLLESKGYEPLN